MYIYIEIYIDIHLCMLIFIHIKNERQFVLIRHNARKDINVLWPRHNFRKDIRSTFVNPSAKHLAIPFAAERQRSASIIPNRTSPALKAGAWSASSPVVSPHEFASPPDLPLLKFDFFEIFEKAF